MEGYKSLVTYKNASIVFFVTWEFVPLYYRKPEDGRQRDQMKQASRSHKQNIVEGSEDRSLSSKLKLYDVARSSGGEVREDYEDILVMEGLPVWKKDDPRLWKIRNAIESTHNPSCSSRPSCSSVLKSIAGQEGQGGQEGQDGRKFAKSEIEIICNYMIDLLIRNRYLLDRQIAAVEEKHRTEGGYREQLLKKRLEYRRTGK